MPYTKLDTCSQALGRLGDELLITAEQLESSANKQSRGCQLYYSKSRRQVLRDHDWDFATRRASLVACTAAPAFGYAYQFSLPSDCIKVRTFNQLEPENEVEMFWEIESSDDDGTVLVTDETTASIKYTYDAPIELFDDLSHEAVVLLFASKLAYFILGNHAKSKDLLDEYGVLINQQGRTVDSQQGHAKRSSRFKHSRWWKARYGRGIN